MKVHSLLALTLVLCTGCGAMYHHQVVLRAPDTKKGPAVFYLDGQEASLNAPFEEVAILQTDGTGNRSSSEEVIAALRVRAGDFGCDAVLRGRVAIDYGHTIATGICVRVLR